MLAFLPHCNALCNLLSLYVSFYGTLSVKGVYRMRQSFYGIALNLVVTALFGGKTKQDHLSHGRAFYSQG